MLYFLIIFSLLVPNCGCSALMADAFARLFARLTRAARESEEGPKEGKRKRNHSFQVLSELFRGKLCQSRQTAIVQVSPKDGGAGGGGVSMHLWWGGGHFGKSGREIWISAKLRHIGWGFDKEALWWQLHGPSINHIVSMVIIVCGRGHKS